MEKKRVIVTFINNNDCFKEDLEIPLDITANDLIYALNSAYQLERSAEGIFGIDGFLKCDNPIALLKGERRLSEYKLHDGTIIIYP